LELDSLSKNLFRNGVLEIIVPTPKRLYFAQTRRNTIRKTIDPATTQVIVNTFLIGKYLLKKRRRRRAKDKGKQIKNERFCEYTLIKQEKAIKTIKPMFTRDFGLKIMRANKIPQNGKIITDNPVTETCSV